MYVEEPWKGSVPEVHQKRTTDGSDLKVIDPNRQDMVTLVGRGLPICTKPQQTAEMNTFY